VRIPKGIPGGNGTAPRLIPVGTLFFRIYLELNFGCGVCVSDNRLNILQRISPEPPRLTPLSQQRWPRLPDIHPRRVNSESHPFTWSCKVIALVAFIFRRYFVESGTKQEKKNRRKRTMQSGRYWNRQISLERLSVYSSSHRARRWEEIRGASRVGVTRTRRSKGGALLRGIRLVQSSDRLVQVSFRCSSRMTVFITGTGSRPRHPPPGNNDAPLLQAANELDKICLHRRWNVYDRRVLFKQVLLDVLGTGRSSRFSHGLRKLLEEREVTFHTDMFILTALWFARAKESLKARLYRAVVTVNASVFICLRLIIAAIRRTHRVGIALPKIKDAFTNRS
jgi:hypothetical protein